MRYLYSDTSGNGNFQGFQFSDFGSGYFYPKTQSSTGVTWSNSNGIGLDLDNQTIKFDSCNGGLRVPFDGTTIGYDACTGKVSVIGGGGASHPMTYQDACGYTLRATYIDTTSFNDKGNLRGFRFADFGTGYFYPRTESSTGVTWDNNNGIGLDLDNQSIKYDMCNGGLHVPFDGTTIDYDACTGKVSVLGGGGSSFSELGMSYNCYNTEYYILGHTGWTATTSVTPLAWSEAYFIKGRSDYADTYVRMKFNAGDCYVTDAKYKATGIHLVQYRGYGGNTFYANISNDVGCNAYSSRLSFDHSCYCYSYQFHVYGNGYVKSNTHEPAFDGAGSLGTSCNKWSVVYAQSGSINTSDERLKDNIRSLNDAEVATALACKDLIRIYQFRDAIQAKGADGARLHVGVMAQALQQAFTDNGLDASDYGMFCYDKNWSWTEWHCEYEVQVQNRDPEGNLLVDENGDPEMVTATELEVLYVEPAEGHSYTSVTPIARHEKWSDPKADGIPDTADVNDTYAVRYDELAMFIIGAIS
jgi:hypothetical protein